MEALTQDMADKAWALIEEVEAMGGMTKAVESGLPKLRIEEPAPPSKQARIDRGEDVIVGVNKYRLAKEDAMPIREIDNTAVRDGAARAPRGGEAEARRQGGASGRWPRSPTRAKSGSGNLLELAVDAARARATVGEVERRARAGVRPLPAPTARRSPASTARPTKRTASGAALKADVEAFEREEGRRPRIMIAKIGQDGHDRGAKVVATAFADLGFDVDVGPLFQTPAEAARQAIENDVHVVGVSTLAAGHKTLVPELIGALARRRVPPRSSSWSAA